MMRRAQRGLRGVDLDALHRVLHLARGEQEGLGLVVVVADELVGHDGAGGDGAVVGGGVADLGALEHVLELADLALELALLLAGRVVAAVLLEVALVAGLADLGDDLLAHGALEVVASSACSLSKASWVSQMVPCSVDWVMVVLRINALETRIPPGGTGRDLSE